MFEKKERILVVVSHSLWQTQCGGDPDVLKPDLVLDAPGPRMTIPCSGFARNPRPHRGARQTKKGISTDEMNCAILSAGSVSSDSCTSRLP
jgi:hypothetical protein